MNSLPESFAVVVVAPRRAGKSFLICHMLRSGLTERFDHIFIFSRTLHMNENYREFESNLTEQEKVRYACCEIEGFNGAPSCRLELLPESERNKFKFYATIDESLIERIMDQQSKAQIAVNQQRRFGKEDVEEPKTLLILDDCLTSEAVNSYGIVNSIGYEGRHMNLSIIMLSQHFNKVGKGLRINADMMIIMKPFSIAEFETFLDQFILRQDRKHMVKAFLHIFDTPYQFLVLNNTSSIQDRMAISHTQEFVVSDYEDLEHINILSQGKTKKRKASEVEAISELEFTQ